jgi:hypothetical protein
MNYLYQLIHQSQFNFQLDAKNMFFYLSVSWCIITFNLWLRRRRRRDDISWRLDECPSRVKNYYQPSNGRGERTSVQFLRLQEPIPTALSSDFCIPRRLSSKKFALIIEIGIAQVHLDSCVMWIVFFQYKKGGTIDCQNHTYVSIFRLKDCDFRSKGKKVKLSL